MGIGGGLRGRTVHIRPSTSSGSVVDVFLKLDGIKGESKDHKHKDEIDIEDFTWKVRQPGGHATGGGGGTGKVLVGDIAITKSVDKSSPSLLLACASGKHIADGLITFRKAGGKPLEYLKIKLQDILVTGMQHLGQVGSLLLETVTLNVARFYLEYQEQQADGSGKPAGEMGWDIKKNEKL